MVHVTGGFWSLLMWKHGKKGYVGLTSNKGEEEGKKDLFKMFLLYHLYISNIHS